MQGRPTWLDAIAGHRCLAQLYDQQEYQQYGDKAIPLDQYLTAPPFQKARLFGLDSGRATLIKYRPANLK